MIFFTADLHFYHINAIKNSNRNFQNVEEMNNVFIENWNKVVTDEDDIYVLGDFTLKGMSYIPDLLSKLQGNKYLIKGNHDKFAKSYSVEGFIWVKDYHEMKYMENHFILSHYPMMSWNRAYHGSYHVHGHIHSDGSYNEENRNRNIRRYDVGVDANELTPISIEQIVDRFE